MQFVALGDRHFSPQQPPDFLGKGLARVAAIHQHGRYAVQRLCVAPHPVQSPLPFGHVRRGDHDKVRQPLAVNADVALDARHFLAAVVTFLLGGVGVADALRVNNQGAGLGLAAISGTCRANLIFLKPAPERSAGHRLASRSRSGNIRAPSATWGTPSATSATGNRFWARTATHKTRHKAQLPRLGLFSRRFQYRPDLLKLLTADVAWIAHYTYLSKTCRILLILNLEQVLRSITRYPKRFKVTADSSHDRATSPNGLGRQFVAKALTKPG